MLAFQFSFTLLSGTVCPLQIAEILNQHSLNTARSPKEQFGCVLTWTIRLFLSTSLSSKKKKKGRVGLFSSSFLIVKSQGKINTEIQDP
jgi:hypothetical protein